MIIYMAKFTNGKIYIGKTKDLNVRIKNHIKNSKKPKLPFHYAIAKYGVNSIEWSILHKDIEDKDINELEIFYINEYKANKYDYGYNITNGGEGGDTISNNINNIIRKQLKSKGVDNYIIIDETIKNDIIHKYIKEKYSLRKLSKFFNITKNRIIRLFDAENIVINKTIACEINSKKIDLSIVNEVINEYNNKNSINKISKKFNLTIMIISRILHDSGVRISKRFL